MESTGQTDLLRSSRDGDQFHYHWAARQALQLLLPGTELVALVVEGVSKGDTASTGGDEVVDLAEYWGSEDLATANRVVYRQLKHSTADPDGPRTSSFLKKTLVGFAKKYSSILKEHPEAAHRVVFEFVSVPPLGSGRTSRAGGPVHKAATSGSERGRVHREAVVRIPDGRGDSWVYHQAGHP